MEMIGEMSMLMKKLDQNLSKPDKINIGTYRKKSWTSGKKSG